jgi:hypothetical protein
MACLDLDEVTGGWRKLHNEDLHNLYSSPSIIRMIKSRRMKWAGHVACMGTKRNTYRISIGKPEEKRRRRKDLRDVGWSGMYWINLAQDKDQWRAVVNMVTCGLHEMLVNSGVAGRLTASQEGLCSMELDTF